MATGTTEFIDLTTADVYLEEKWSKKCTVEREKHLVFVPNIDGQFEPELKKGQILHIGNITHPTGRTKSQNTAITFETVTETESTITIETYQYAAIALEDVIKPMCSVPLLDKYVPGLSYALSLLEDTSIAAMIDDGTITQTVGTLATELDYENLVRGDQYLNDANVPEDGRCLIISPAQKAGFMKMDHFIHRDYSDTRKGILGSWMGTYPIFVTTNTDGSNAAGHDNYMGHRECIAHVCQLQPYVRSWWDGDYQCAKMSAITTYGSTIRRADHGVWLQGA